MKPPIPSLDGRVCLVTGAASGIGRAVAYAAVADGARVVLTDVNAAGLDAVASDLGEAVAASRALDIGSYEAVRAFADDVLATVGPVDVIMNIAGIATWGAVQKLSHEQWRKTVDVNLMGPIHVIECFVPALIAARRPGQIVNISSAAGLSGLPWHAPYSATKFGLRGLSEVLRYDLRRRRIGVTVVCPGAVNTGLVKTVDIAGVSAGAREGLTKHFVRHAAPPEKVARIIIDAVEHNRYLVYTGWDIRVFYAIKRHAPRVYDLVMKVVNDVMQGMLKRAARKSVN